MMHKIFISIVIWISVSFFFVLHAQEYVSPTKPTETGKSPEVKTKLLSVNGTAKTYSLIFSPGDEILSGLEEFALRYNVKSAYFTAIGDASFAKFGWYDESKKMFKVTEIKQPVEIVSLVGDIALYNNEPAVHCHIALAAEDGVLQGGHLLEAFISPTLEVMITVEPTPLYKKLDPEFSALIIDPELKN
ncbi:MAG TPA: PPC domain-containing DNA-binding protein [Bacteroidia bacterium]|nr:PPC domain-containing DNA-binding protein [Bacteroidia bacterium]